jgi:hypothetical protein
VKWSIICPWGLQILLNLSIAIAVRRKADELFIKDEINREILQRIG